MTSCNCLLCRSTCRVVGYLFKILKRSKEANNKRQRLESKLYIGFLLFIFSSLSSYLWIAFSISNCLFRSVFLKENSFYLSFSRPIFTVVFICWWPFLSFFCFPKLSFSFLLPVFFVALHFFKRRKIDEPIRISFSHGD